MMRLEAVAGNSCLNIRSLIVLLTIYWLAEVRSLSTLAYHLSTLACQKVAAKLFFGKGRPAKRPKRRLCRPL